MRCSNSPKRAHSPLFTDAKPQDPEFHNRIRHAQERPNPHHSRRDTFSGPLDSLQPSNNSPIPRQPRSSTIPKNDNSDYLHHVEQLNKGRPLDRDDLTASNYSEPDRPRDYKSNPEEKQKREEDYNLRLLKNLDKLAEENQYKRLYDEYEDSRDPRRRRLDQHASNHELDKYSSEENNNLARSHSVGNHGQFLPSQIFENNEYNHTGQSRARSLSKNPTNFS